MRPIRLYPKNKEMQQYLERLLQSPTILMPCRKAMDFGRNKTIRYLRETDRLYIGNDRRKNTSIIHLNGHIRKKDNKYFFE